MRFLLLSLSLLSLGAAQPPEGGSQPQHTERANPPPVRVTITNFPSLKDAGCDEGQTKRDSDLCAQWEAADASRKAANYSLWAVFISLVGTGFLFFTFVESRKVSRAELRAYVLVRAVEIQRFANGQKFEARVSFANSGQTPAFRMTAQHRLFVAPRPHPPEFAVLAPSESNGIQRSGEGCACFSFCFGYIMDRLPGEQQIEIAIKAPQCAP
jgi:hypothetical protein